MLPPRGGAGGQRPDEAAHPPLHAPRSSPDEAFREGEAPSEPVRWACAVRTPSRWAASAVETPSRLSRPPGTPLPRAVRQLHKPCSARLPRRQPVGYRGPWPSALRGCRVAAVTGGVVNGRLLGQFSNGIVNRWGKTWCGIWCGFINNGWPPVFPSGTERWDGPRTRFVLRLILTKSTLCSDAVISASCHVMPNRNRQPQ